MAGASCVQGWWAIPQLTPLPARPGPTPGLRMNSTWDGVIPVLPIPSSACPDPLGYSIKIALSVNDYHGYTDYCK